MGATSISKPNLVVAPALMQIEYKVGNIDPDLGAFKVVYGKGDFIKINFNILFKRQGRGRECIILARFQVAAQPEDKTALRIRNKLYK